MIMSKIRDASRQHSSVFPLAMLACLALGPGCTAPIFTLPPVEEKAEIPAVKLVPGPFNLEIQGAERYRTNFTTMAQPCQFPYLIDHVASVEAAIIEAVQKRFPGAKQGLAGAPSVIVTVQEPRVLMTCATVRFGAWGCTAEGKSGLTLVAELPGGSRTVSADAEKVVNGPAAGYCDQVAVAGTQALRGALNRNLTTLVTAPEWDKP